MTYVIGLPCVDIKDRACVEECPAYALAGYREENVRFFTDTLSGRSAPLGSPGGAATLGPLDVDTELVTALPVQAEPERP